MTEVKIFAVYSQFLGEVTANFKDSYSQAYSPMCESSINDDLNPLNTRLLCYCSFSETILFYDVIVISCNQTRSSPGLVLFRFTMSISIVLLIFRGEIANYTFFKALKSTEYKNQCFHFVLNSLWRPSWIFKMATTKI